MKKQIIYASFLFVCLLNGCAKYLDSEPANFLTDKDIYGSEEGATAYLARLYSLIPIEDFNMRPGTQNGLTATAYQAHLTGEAINAPVDEKASVGAGISLQWWRNSDGAYFAIRDINTFIEKLPTATFTEDLKNKFMGEAKFLRAYCYFGLVKRYGGVPIITKPQAYSPNDLTPLYVSRNTEKECYDFIAQDLDEAIAKLSVTSVSGRVNKYAALAFKSRVMLFPASIAKYGNLDLNNILGVPSVDAGKYWQAAYDAAKAVIDANRYSLYNKNPDKAQNFADLFLVPESAGNPEIIFARYWLYPYKGHSYDRNNLPFSQKSPAGYSSRINPTLELVEKYEYINNPDGRLKLADASGKLIRYANPLDIFKDKDPWRIYLPLLKRWCQNAFKL